MAISRNPKLSFSVSSGFVQGWSAYYFFKLTVICMFYEVPVYVRRANCLLQRFLLFNLSYDKFFVLYTYGYFFLFFKRKCSVSSNFCWNINEKFVIIAPASFGWSVNESSLSYPHNSVSVWCHKNLLNST